MIEGADGNDRTDRLPMGKGQAIHRGRIELHGDFRSASGKDAVDTYPDAVNGPD